VASQGNEAKRQAVGAAGKKTAMETIKYTLPAYWAPYLINADATGFDIANTPDDPDAGTRKQLEIDAWLESEGNSCFVDCGESYFSWGNDATNLGDDVCDFVAIKKGNSKP